jgi:hypothetical protein
MKTARAHRWVSIDLPVEVLLYTQLHSSITSLHRKSADHPKIIL